MRADTITNSLCNNVPICAITCDASSSRGPKSRRRPILLKNPIFIEWYVPRMIMCTFGGGYAIARVACPDQITFLHYLGISQPPVRSLNVSKTSTATSAVHDCHDHKRNHKDTFLLQSSNDDQNTLLKDSNHSIQMTPKTTTTMTNTRRIRRNHGDKSTSSTSNHELSATTKKHSRQQAPGAKKVDDSCMDNATGRQLSDSDCDNNENSIMHNLDAEIAASDKMVRMIVHGNGITWLFSFDLIDLI